ncbi:competence type IV pilus minor pilin ComGG [Sporolactobacillus kofuensis]|uniref:Competence type IV pilus minor pilin ComGG n=1 Tax=Sporolactobacillus kofuensis TaxID=269672 RepID=A0ABW1WKK6_9BACL
MSIHRFQNENGFVLPLTIMLSVILLAFVIHSVLLLNSDRQFFQQTNTRYQLQQIRESVLVDIENQMKEKKLANQGTFVYHKGTVTYTVNDNGSQLSLTLTISVDHSQEVDRIIYSKESGKPLSWLERIDP